MIRIANIIKLTGLYTINSSFITLLSIIYFISGFQSLSIEISILHSCIAFFTFSLSSYSKNLIVIDKSMYKIFNDYNFRFRISIVVLIFILLILICFKIENFFILFFISIILLFQWLFELIIAKSEINNDYRFINFNFVFFSFFLFTLFTLFFLELYDYYRHMIIFFSIYISIYVAKNALIIIFLKDSIKNKILLLLKDYSIISSSALPLANLIWKILIVFFYGKIFSASLFFIFTLCSFVSTLYNNSLGYSLLRKHSNFNLLFVVIYLFLVVLIIFNYDFIIYFIPKEIEILIDDRIFFKKTIIYSFIGSFFMLVGQYLRSLSLYSNIHKRTAIFKSDIVYSFALIFYCLIIIFFRKIEDLQYLFLLGGISNFIIYFFLGYYLNKKKNIITSTIKL